MRKPVGWGLLLRLSEALHVHRHSLSQARREAAGCQLTVLVPGVGVGGTL